MGPSPESTPPASGRLSALLLALRQNAVALFATFHIVCVFVYGALPNPPGLDDATLAQPEVRAELDDAMNRVPDWLVWRPTRKQMLEDLLGVARSYERFTGRARRLVTPYLDLIDSTQSWHMFGGTPPRF